MDGSIGGAQDGTSALGGYIWRLANLAVIFFYTLFQPTLSNKVIAKLPLCDGKKTCAMEPNGKISALNRKRSHDDDDDDDDTQITPQSPPARQASPVLSQTTPTPQSQSQLLTPSPVTPPTYQTPQHPPQRYGRERELFPTTQTQGLFFTPPAPTRPAIAAARERELFPKTKLPPHPPRPPFLQQQQPPNVEQITHELVEESALLLNILSHAIDRQQCAIHQIAATQQASIQAIVPHTMQAYQRHATQLHHYYQRHAAWLSQQSIAVQQIYNRTQTNTPVTSPAVTLPSQDVTKSMDESP